MSVRVFCVLRSGGDFLPEDVAALKVGVDRHIDLPLYCLSDVEVPCNRISLNHDYPGWWSKMELFRPDLHGDIFYLDLDTVIVNDARPLLDTGSTSFMLDDFYNPKNPASGLMYLAENDRADVWNQWMKDPQGFMRSFRGDQDFLAWVPFGKYKARRWQRDFPHQIISFKANMRPKPPRGGPHMRVPPQSTRIVCFHGKPRPRNVREEWVIQARTAA